MMSSKIQDIKSMLSFLFTRNKLNKREEKESGNRAILSDSKQFLNKNCAV